MNTAPTPDEWLVPAEAAKHAKVSPACIYAAVARGDLRAVRVGGRRSIRLRRGWVDAWLEGLPVYVGQR